MNVYAIVGTMTQLVKLGRTQGTVEGRLEELQSWSPDRLEILAVAERPARDEIKLHVYFKEHRLHGEWFDTWTTNYLRDCLVDQDFGGFIDALPEIRRARRRRQRPRCGSTMGYQRHLYYRERPCRDCDDVYTRHMRTIRALE